MKTILVLAFAVLTFTAAPVATQACDTYRSGSCVPVVVYTKEVCRYTKCCWATNSCGHRYSYEVTVVTFADVYSDGSSQRYTRSFRS